MHLIFPVNFHLVFVLKSESEREEGREERWRGIEGEKKMGLISW